MFESFSNINEGEGGNLAARLTPAQRMDMIQRGYNPLSSADVERYFNKEKPMEGLMEVAGVSQYKNLGGGKGIDPRDKGLITKELEEFEEFSTSPSNLNLRDAVNSKMNSYSSKPRDINSALTTKLNQITKESKSQVSPKTIPLSQKKSFLITESKQAKNIGYKLGINYLNSFVDLLKSPNTENRTKFIEQINNLVLAEKKIHPAMLEDYRTGIAFAEKQLYNKLKNKNEK
jgi:hypothetical protein